MTSCPPRLRGGLSKWLCEINTGVYVGNVSSRVRDAVWDRVCQYLKNGQATMVYTAAGEQKMEFRTHNTSWEVVDYDGIKLMRRPLPQAQPQVEALELKPGFSKAAKYQMAQKMAQRAARPPGKQDYTVIDLETTGLHAATDAIVEYGAVRVRDGQPGEEFSALVRLETPLPAEIARLTGITQEEIDLLPLARRKILGLSSYKLLALAQHFALADKVEHRAVPDCRLTQKVYAKLNENGAERNGNSR